MRIEYILLSIFSIALIVYLRTTNKSALTKKETFIYFIIFIIATSTGKLWGIATTSSFFKSIEYFNESYKDLKLYNSLKITPEWKVKSVNTKYKNYVVIIGESARRDYHEIYGYPVKNNPFLSSVNGVFVDGFNSVGLNTIPSLHATLNHNKNLNLNLIDLANMAGFETFWYSNQGYLGTFDTLTTIVAKQAKHRYFQVMQSDKIHDSDLVKQFATIFDKPSNKNRIIFLHFIGSHPIICNKLESKEYLNYPDKATFNINCYVETIRQTDSNLKEIYNILARNLKQNGETFSMIYFSDHGLTHTKDKVPIDLLVTSNISKEHLQIPLIKISSDDTNRILIKNTSYENYFVQSFAKWIGVETENFKEISDIFDSIEQKDILNSKALIKNPNSDLAIDISKFIKN